MSDAETGIKPWQGDRPVKVEFLVRKHMIDKALDNPRRFDIFHPSAWGVCLRKIAYQYYNELDPFVFKTADDIKDQMERVFDNGHGSHHRWQTYLDHAGVLRGVWRCINPFCAKLYGTEDKLGVFNPSREKGWKCECGSEKRLAYEEAVVKSAPEYNFEGHCDGIIDVRGTPFAQNNKYDVFVADLKTMKEEYFMELMEPKTEHVVQVNIYMWILDLHGAVVVYENKNDQRLKEMFVPRDDALIDKIKAQSVWMMDILKAKKLPFRPNEFSRSKIPCRWCEFVDYCYR